jgi:hypothetical protein
VYEYLQALQVGGDKGTPDVPTFQELLRDLQRGCFHNSSSWLPLPASITVDPSALVAGSVSTGATRTTRASTVAPTAVSGLTTTTGGGRASGGGNNASTSTQGTYIANPARDPEFDALQLRPGMRDLLRAHPPPANDAGNELCVSWWGRGGCYNNCGRAATHRSFANAAERARLLTHVKAHLVVAPAPGSGT